MPIRNILVTYRQINEALHKNHEAVMASTHDRATAALGNPIEAASKLVGLSAALDALEAEEKYPDVLVSPTHLVASLLQSYLAEHADAAGKLELQPSGLREAKFDDKDWLGWIGSFFSWWKGLDKHAWLTAPSTPEVFGNTARVALLGDWGTGLYGAPVSAQTIAHATPGYYGLLMHLGDVYYAGSVHEVQERFLALWPNNAGAVSRALNSNHEMYTGGHGYFELTLPQFGQAASYFALQNDHWVLVGLDSAYSNPHHGSLTDDQVTWLQGIINHAEDRKIVLFSHHQAFSRLETADDTAEKLGALLEAKNIFAWYWGHEHRCVLYDQHPRWGLFGRCVGHGGYPYSRDRDHLAQFPRDPSVPNSPAATWRRLEGKNLIPGGLLLDGPNPYVSGHEDEYGTQGHMTLVFDGAHLDERVHLPDGTVIYNRTLA